MVSMEEIYAKEELEKKKTARVGMLLQNGVEQAHSVWMVVLAWPYLMCSQRPLPSKYVSFIFCSPAGFLVVAAVVFPAGAALDLTGVFEDIFSCLLIESLNKIQ